MQVQNDMVWGNYSDLIYKKTGSNLGHKAAEDLEIRPGETISLVRQNKSLDLR